MVPSCTTRYKCGEIHRRVGHQRQDHSLLQEEACGIPDGGARDARRCDAGGHAGAHDRDAGRYAGAGHIRVVSRLLTALKSPKFLGVILQVGRPDRPHPPERLLAEADHLLGVLHEAVHAEVVRLLDARRPLGDALGVRVVNVRRVLRREAGARARKGVRVLVPCAAKEAAVGGARAGGRRERTARRRARARLR